MPHDHSEYVYSVLTGEANIAADPIVKKSWTRCFQYGLDPGKPPPIEIVKDLAERLHRRPDLLTAAHTELEMLRQQLSGSESIFSIADSDGVILDLLCDPIFEGAAQETGVSRGANWSERLQGTNSIGTCLAEKAPTAIHRREHFLGRNTSLSCAAVPVFDPRGSIAAVIDATVPSRIASTHVIALLNIAAQSIEYRTFLYQFPNSMVLRIHTNGDLVPTQQDGLLALDASGIIRGLNPTAGRLLTRPVASLLDTGLEELFGIPFDTLLKRYDQGGIPLHLPEQGLHMRLERPFRSARPKATASARAPSSRGCASDTLRTKLDELTLGDPKMEHNIRCAKRVLGQDIPIMLQGETGTGKEMFAKAIHLSSVRANHPFVAVNCASIPESLIESELFGYDAGAFTGANRKGYTGKLVHANGGTLFLDEIGDMPLHLQARLLRVLEERQVLPLGSNTPIPVDIQLISATHRQLPSLVTEGRFREDLYYRLQGVVLTLPPLRERRDKRHLIEHLFSQCSEQIGLQPGTIRLTSKALDVLERYDWPGNVRQLCHVVRTTLALREGDLIGEADLPMDLLYQAPVQAQEPPPSPAPVSATDRAGRPLETAEKEILKQALVRFYWNISKVAKELNISRNTVYRKMLKYNLQAPND